MPRDDTVVLEDVELRFRNFAGREGMYNKEGDRNFAVMLPRDVAQQMANEGWNIKQLKPRDEDGEPEPYIAVSLGYKGYSKPLVRMITHRNHQTRATDLDEDEVEILDWVDIERVDLIIRPHDWSFGGNAGRKAYLQSMYITIIEDPLQVKYADIATVDGPMMERTEPLLPDNGRG